MRAERFMYFYFKNYIGTQGEVCRQLECLEPQAVYANDRSNAVLVLWLCGFDYWPFHVVLHYSLFLCCFSPV